MIFGPVPSASASLAEGDLSRVPRLFGPEEALHRLALQIELPAITCAWALAKWSGRLKRACILADALEALFMPSTWMPGFETAYQVVHRLFVQDLESPALAEPGQRSQDRIAGMAASRAWKPAGLPHRPDHRLCPSADLCGGARSSLAVSAHRPGQPPASSCQNSKRTGCAATSQIPGHQPR